MELVDISNYWISIIGNFGFFIAITIYLFIRFEKKIGELEKVISNLTTLIESFVECNRRK